MLVARPSVGFENIILESLGSVSRIGCNERSIRISLKVETWNEKDNKKNYYSYKTFSQYSKVFDKGKFFSLSTI